MARVTLVVNSFDEGSETFLHTLAGQLDTLGHDVTVHALLDGRTTMSTGSVVRAGRRPALGGVAAGAIPQLRAGARPFRRATTRRQCSRWAGERSAGSVAVVVPPERPPSRRRSSPPSPDVVHLAFSGLGVALVDAIELLEPATKLVVSCRGTGELVSPVLDESIRPGLRRVLERADRVHAVADVVAEAAVDVGGGPRSGPGDPTGRRRCGVPPVGPAPRAQRGAARRDRGPAALDQGDRRAARQRCALLGARGRDVTWTIVGDGPDRQALEFRARVLGVGDRVSFLGSAPP